MIASEAHSPAIRSAASTRGAWPGLRIRYRQFPAGSGVNVVVFFFGAKSYAARIRQLEIAPVGTDGIERGGAIPIGPVFVLWKIEVVGVDNRVVRNVVKILEYALVMKGNLKANLKAAKHHRSRPVLEEILRGLRISIDVVFGLGFLKVSSHQAE